VEVARSKLKLADAGRCWVCGSATVSDVQAARAELTSALSSMESLNVKVKDAKMLSQAAAEWLAWRSRRGKARLMAVRDRRLEAELLSSAAGCLAPEARSILASGTPSEHLEASRKSTVALVASLRDSLARSAPASLPSRSEVLAARSAVKALAAAGARLEALTAEALKVEAAVRVRESELTEALRLDAIAAARSRKRSLLKGASDLLSGENLQRALAARMSLLVNSALKANLEELGASFEVSLEPSLDFSVRVNGNKAGPMALSGGQRCLAGIALRLAAFTASGAGCGVLVLDEPTAFLDTRARTALRESLPRLSRSILKSGICLLIPTHDPELADVCGEVVNL
jgi:DNA repair exonuclease SbcCD ATPase subunit